MLLWPDVSMDIELREEDKEENGVRGDVVGELPGKSAILVKCQLETVKHDCHELKKNADHLSSYYARYTKSNKLPKRSGSHLMRLAMKLST